MFMRLFGSIRRLIGGIIGVIAGIAMIANGAGQLIDDTKTPYNYSDLALGDYKAGMIVEGSLPTNYGCYEEVTKTDDNGKTDSVGSFYLIDAGEGFMGFYTTRLDLQAQLENQFEQSYESSVPTYVSFKGKVKKMDNEDIKYFRDCLSYYGLSEAEMNDYSTNLYISVVYTSGYATFMVVGALMLLVGAFFIVMFVLAKLRGR